MLIWINIGAHQPLESCDEIAGQADGLGAFWRVQICAWALANDVDVNVVRRRQYGSFPDSYEYLTTPSPQTGAV